MSNLRPNILLIMTDEHRADCLGIAGHPVVQTPNLDAVAAAGVRFTRAYAPCPLCVPSRRSILTGQRARTHGVLNDVPAPLHSPTLPGELSQAGYQTHLVGKLGLWPPRARYGFQSMDWADGPKAGVNNDYQRFLQREGVTDPLASDAHGVDSGGWTARPWHLPDRLHFTNWCTDRAIEFLERRDPTCPFFLQLSYLHPHQPLTPPRFYYDRYMAMDLPEPYVGDWARIYDRPMRGQPVDSYRVSLEPQMMKQYRAAYYASIDHIDDQIARILPRVPEDTIVCFLSDHGEMLGDHQWVRKRNAYEPSARIPFFIRFPETMGMPQGQCIDRLVDVTDVMPTLLDAVGLPVPESVEGRSVRPLLRGETVWRAYLHGECANITTLNSGMQFLTDGRWKYVWFPALAKEQLFDLATDPREMTDLAPDPASTDELRHWRELLVRELTGRPEGFTDGDTLLRLAGPTADIIGPLSHLP
jgi:arylsulfatase A-like enzyme